MLRLYDFECNVCKTVQEHIVTEKEDVVCECGQKKIKLLAACNINMGPSGAYGYYDETLGTYIETNYQRREECRKQGVTPTGDTPKPTGDAWV